MCDHRHESQINWIFLASLTLPFKVLHTCWLMVPPQRGCPSITLVRVKHLVSKAPNLHVSHFLVIILYWGKGFWKLLKTIYQFFGGAGKLPIHWVHRCCCYCCLWALLSTCPEGKVATHTSTACTRLACSIKVVLAAKLLSHSGDHPCSFWAKWMLCSCLLEIERGQA